jgi:hypothetical protein
MTIVGSQDYGYAYGGKLVKQMKGISKSIKIMLLRFSLDNNLIYIFLI